MSCRQSAYCHALCDTDEHLVSLAGPQDRWQPVPNPKATQTARSSISIPDEWRGQDR